LRINIGDDYGKPGDRLVVGTRNYLDAEWYTHMIVQGNGKIGLGTEEIGSERLAVNGSIRAKEIKVEANSWPDYVFEEGYDLISIEELDKYVQTHGHLPGIPNAATAKREGINLGDFNAKLLEKIEELTLHMIRYQQTVEQQAERIDKLEGQLTKILNE